MSTPASFPVQYAIPPATVPPRLERFAREMARTYSNPDWPEEIVYSVIADSLRVIGRISKKSNDSSCVEFSEEELGAEGRAKMIQLFNGRSGVPGKKDALPVLQRIKDRADLFKFITACFNNHTRGLVHRHRFTAKRTGSKVPPKGSPELAEWGRKHQKPEVSLDAQPELRSRLEFHATTTPSGCDEVDDDMEEMLTPLEYLVYQQYAHPNAGTLALMALDAWRGGTVCEVSMKPEHLAGGLGLSVHEFEAIAATVREKFDRYRSGKMASVSPIAPASADRREAFTPPEFLVYQQLVHPNQLARSLAQASRSPLQPQHLAAGIGMPTELFLRLTATVNTKLMDNSSQQHAAVGALEAIFEVQVPRSLPAVIVRRLFTLAARFQYEKVTDEVADLLRNVGAEVPKMNSQGNLTCFGVLFSRNHHVCSACQARLACQTAAANFGLYQVTLSPTLLSARASVRTAELIGAPLPEDTKRPTVPASEREEEVRSYLGQHFKRTTEGGEEHYRHRNPSGRNIVRLCSKSRGQVDHSDLNASFLVGFCNPSIEIRKKLVRVRGAFYAPESMAVQELKDLINEHANRLFAHRVGAVVEAKSTSGSLLSEVLMILGTGMRNFASLITDGIHVRPVKPVKRK